MSTTLSLRIDEELKKRLEALAKRSRRSKSSLAAEPCTTSRSFAEGPDDCRARPSSWCPALRTSFRIVFVASGLEVIAVLHGRQGWPDRL